MADKQTSPAVSSKASRVMRQLVVALANEDSFLVLPRELVQDALSVAASALSQDETPGQNSDQDRQTASLIKTLGGQ